MSNSSAFQRALAKSRPVLDELLAAFHDVRERKLVDEKQSREDERRCLIHALQGAAALELSTIPPYLCALWSIRDDRHPVAASLREVAQEEMLHLALVTNLLVAIGGKPDLRQAALSYPTKLPLGAHPTLTVHLGKLDDDRLLEFLHIERPAEGVVPGGGQHPRTRDVVALATSPSDGKTIGELYTTIDESFQRLQPYLSTARQITGPLAWSVTWSLKGVNWSIDLIKRQGEGAQGIYEGHTGDLAHFYRFWQVFEGRAIVPGDTAGSYLFGDEIPFDPTTEVFPMAVVPAGGYLRKQVSEEVWHLLHGFDCTYSRLLDLLQGVWERDGGQASFWQAIAVMFELEKFARPLMQIPIPGGKGETYGPCFRYLAPEERDHHV